LYRQLTGRSAFLSEDYVVAHMLEYQKYATRTQHVRLGVPRDPAAITGLLRDGVEVYGFGDAIAQLDGRLSVRGVTLWAPSLNARLGDLSNGSLVVVAGSAEHWPLLDALDVGVRPTGGGVVVALKGFGPIFVTPPAFEGSIDIRRGEPLGKSGQIAAMDVHVEVHGAEATIEVDGQPVVRSTGGLAVAEMGSRLWDTYVLLSGNAYRPALDMRRRPLFRVTGVLGADACTDIGDGTWHRLREPGSSGRLVGRIDNVRPFDATWVVYLAAEHPLSAGVQSWFGRQAPALNVQAYVPGRDAELHAQLAEDNFPASPELLSAPVVTRLAVKVNDEGQSTAFRVSLGGRPTAGWGRAITDRQTLERGSACALPPDLLEPRQGTGRAHLYLGPGGDWMFGPGWGGAASTPVGFHRVLRGSESRLLLPAAGPAPVALHMSVEPIGADAIVAVSLNGGPPVPATRVATGGWNELSWPVGTAPQWRDGINDLTIQINRPRGLAPRADEPALRVRAIELEWSSPR
jgi:hypothetical protein